MGELIRFQQASAAAEGEAPLLECDLSLMEGEVLMLLGNRSSGAGLLKEILKGKRRIQKGRLYCRENRVRTGLLDAAGTLSVLVDRPMSRSLTLEQSLKCLGGFGHAVTRGELERLLAEVGLNRPLKTRTGDCTPSEQIQLWFALAILRDCRLVCLEPDGHAFRKEEESALGQAMEALRKRGASTVVFSEWEIPLMERADRIAWMRNGRVSRIFYGAAEWRQAFPEGTGPAWGAEGVREKDEEKKETGAGTLSGTIRFEEGAARPEKGYLADGICFVPADSHRHLSERAGIGWNLMLAVSKKSGSRFGLINRSMERFLEGEFRREFDISGEAVQVSDLSAEEKKLLTLYRVYLLHPDRIVLEDPFAPFSPEGRPRAEQLIRRMADDGCEVVLTGII